MNTLNFVALALATTLAGNNVHAQTNIIDAERPGSHTRQAGVTTDWRWPLTPNGAYEQLPIKETKGAPLVWQPIQEMGLSWKKRVWREISTLEKQNQPFSYAGDEHTGGGMLIEILIDAIKTGKVAAYTTDDNRFTTVLSKEALQAMVMGKADTHYIYDAVGDSEIMAISFRDFNPATITKYRLIEDWLFDNNTGKMVVRIAGLAPVRDIYDANNQYRGPQAMFWLYYPHIREVLATYEAVNPANDMQRDTWDEFFEGRKFAGIITKVSNSHGSIAGSYGESYREGGYTAMEALYEGKRAADGLFNKEHDMWNH